jgi:ech hydrogenase subunit D
MSDEKHLIQNIVPVKASELTDKIQDLKNDGYRLGQACALTNKGELQIIYSLDKDHVLLNLRLNVPADLEVPSITGIFWAAFIYENEMHDLFGFKFKNLALDYGGNFFQVSEPTPWNPDARKGGK